ncbi:MAG: DUF4405 domain-containing protein [Treponema sp.]|jgi:hypothetical protein|nr:DUF4405 domain-containing protein [Treponema sp.]
MVQNIFRGAYNLRRNVMTAVTVSLALVMATLLITGLLHSRTALAFLHSPGDMTIRQIHTTAAYWTLILIDVHLGLHWGMIMNAFHKALKINGESRE